MNVPKKPDYIQAIETLDIFLKPYVHEFNTSLRGDTSVRYRRREFESNDSHRFDFLQTIDNLFKRGIISGKARLVLRSQK